MYIIVIGWLYVVIMIAIVSDSWLKGIVRLLFLGVLPVAILLLFSARRRRPSAVKEPKAASNNQPNANNSSATESSTD